MIVLGRKLCPVCKTPINPHKNWEHIKDMYDEILDQADYLGVESLTEQEQVLYENNVHADCFYELE